MQPLKLNVTPHLNIGMMGDTQTVASKYLVANDYLRLLPPRTDIDIENMELDQILDRMKKIQELGRAGFDVDKAEAQRLIARHEVLTGKCQEKIDSGKAALTKLETDFRSVAHTILPRRYLVPQGASAYISPSSAAERLAYVILHKARKPDMPKPQLEDYVFDDASVFATHGSPVYFIKRELLEAVDATELPDDLKLKDVKFPCRSMLIMLPIGYLPQEDGDPINWLLVTLRTGVIESPLLDKPILNFTHAAGGEAISVVGCFKTHSGPWLISAANGSLDMDLAAYKADTRIYSCEESQKLRKGDNTACRDLTERNMELAIKILLLMVARPDFVELRESIARPAKTKRGRERDALWNANFIGFHWKRSVSKGEKNEDGSIMRPHIRRGHWRHVAYGPKHTLRRIQWIEAIWVNWDSTESE